MCWDFIVFVLALGFACWVLFVCCFFFLGGGGGGGVGGFIFSCGRASDWFHITQQDFWNYFLYGLTMVPIPHVLSGWLDCCDLSPGIFWFPLLFCTFMLSVNLSSSNLPVCVHILVASVSQPCFKQYILFIITVTYFQDYNQLCSCTVYPSHDFQLTRLKFKIKWWQMCFMSQFCVVLLFVFLNDT